MKRLLNKIFPTKEDGEVQLEKVDIAISKEVKPSVASSHMGSQVTSNKSTFCKNTFSNQIGRRVTPSISTNNKKGQETRHITRASDKNPFDVTPSPYSRKFSDTHTGSPEISSIKSSQAFSIEPIELVANGLPSRPRGRR